MKITHKITGAVLFEKDVELMRLCLQAAVEVGADLRSANLRYADLRDADLRSANLRYANLKYANLRYANLRYANLRDANLRYADLMDANLRGANLRDANLMGANLMGADMCVIQTGPYTAYIGPEKTLIGCKFYDNADWLKWTTEDVAHMDVHAKEYWDRWGNVIKTVIQSFSEQSEEKEAA